MTFCFVPVPFKIDLAVYNPNKLKNPTINRMQNNRDLKEVEVIFSLGRKQSRGGQSRVMMTVP